MMKLFDPVFEGKTLLKSVGWQTLEFVHDEGMYIEFNGEKAVEIRAIDIDAYPRCGRKGLGDEIYDAYNCRVDRKQDEKGNDIIEVDLFGIIESDQGVFEEECANLNNAFQEILDQTITKEEFKAFISKWHLAYHAISYYESWHEYFMCIMTGIGNKYSVDFELRVIEANLPDFKSFLEAKFVYGGETIAELK